MFDTLDWILTLTAGERKRILRAVRVLVNAGMSRTEAAQLLFEHRTRR